MPSRHTVPSACCRAEAFTMPPIWQRRAAWSSVAPRPCLPVALRRGNGKGTRGIRRNPGVGFHVVDEAGPVVGDNVVATQRFRRKTAVTPDRKPPDHEIGNGTASQFVHSHRELGRVLHCHRSQFQAMALSPSLQRGIEGIGYEQPASCALGGSERGTVGGGTEHGLRLLGSHQLYRMLGGTPPRILCRVRGPGSSQ